MRTLKFTKSLLLKTKLRGSGNILIIATAGLFMLLLMLSYLYRFQLMTLNRQVIDESLTSAMLGAEVVDLSRYAEDENIVLVDNTRDIFIELIKANLCLSDNWEINRPGLTGEVKVEDFRVYNKISTSTGHYIQEIVKSTAGSYTIDHAEGEVVKVKTTDGDKVITDTSLYVKISFMVNTIGYAENTAYKNEPRYKRYALSRLVSVEIN